MILDAIVDLAPSPSPRVDVKDEPRPLDAAFSAFVFKVQANMDPSHRDRLAFARICSGRFERGMTVECDRTGPRADDEVRHDGVRRRPRDGRGGLSPATSSASSTPPACSLGDTIYAAGPDGVPVTFPPIPRFSPEVFATARPLDTGRAKQFRRGLEQLDEEGVVQVLRDPDLGDAEHVLAAVGAAAVRGVRPPPGQRVQRPGRDPDRRLPGDPAHRSAVGAPAPRDRRHPDPATAPTARSSPCSRTGTAWLASRPTSPSCTLEPLVAGAIPAF